MSATTTQPTRRPLAATIALALIATGTAACSNSESQAEGTATTPTSSAPSSATASASSASAPSNAANSSASAAAVGGVFALTHPKWPDTSNRLIDSRITRVGSHQGFDRVVFEFTGKAAPVYKVAYNPKPTLGSSDQPAKTKGKFIIDVQVAGVENGGGHHPLRGDLKTAGITEITPPGGGWEGYAQAFIGLPTKRPFKVSTLTNPSRLVIDIERR